MAVLECAVPNLSEELDRLLAQLVPGEVTTFGALATALGDTRAARWVKEALSDHVHSADCRCHRVVTKQREVNVSVDAAVFRLQADGISINEGEVDSSAVRQDPFDSKYPLKALRESQESLYPRVKLTPLESWPEQVAGVDLSYVTPHEAIAGYAVVETLTGNLVWSKTIQRRIRFPYITGFLAFRELPVLLDLMNEVDRQNQRAPVIMVDGNGILHPLRAGVATHLGVLLDHPTIGVSKKLMCGEVDYNAVTPSEPQSIVHEEGTIGYAVRATQDNKPVFVSPGHLMSLSDSLKLTQQLFHGHRLPEATFQADHLSRAAIKLLEDEGIE